MDAFLGRGKLFVASDVQHRLAPRAVNPLARALDPPDSRISRHQITFGHLDSSINPDARHLFPVPAPDFQNPQPETPSSLVCFEFPAQQPPP